MVSATAAAKPERFTARALNGHSAIGLTIAALAYLICLTGTLAVFTDELKLLEQPLPAPGPLQAGAIDRAARAALDQTPDTATLYVLAPSTASARLTLTSYGAGGEKNWLADTSGRIQPMRTPWTEFVDEFHMNLTARSPWGSLAVGLIGVAMVSLVLSGVLAHPRIFRDAFRLRLGAAKRLREADLHNRMSVWGLPFHLAISLTGAFFGIASLPVMAIAALQFHRDVARVYQSLSGPEIPADSRPAPMPDLDAVVARARAELPGSTLYYLGVERPGTAGTRIRVEVTGPGPPAPRRPDLLRCGRQRDRPGRLCHRLARAAALFRCGPAAFRLLGRSAGAPRLWDPGRGADLDHGVGRRDLAGAPARPGPAHAAAGAGLARLDPRRAAGACCCLAALRRCQRRCRVLDQRRAAANPGTAALAPASAHNHIRVGRASEAVREKGAQMVDDMMQRSRPAA